jgi:hypothetical protein
MRRGHWCPPAVKYHPDVRRGADCIKPSATRPRNACVMQARVGLMQAVKRFEPEKGFRLATYAAGLEFVTRLGESPRPALVRYQSLMPSRT